jgi:catechol 2,3-dioxygenase-like lactoylglutathione lyase family enzyme
MELGAFSVSLSVRDLAASRAFYETLGFEVFHDASEMNYLIMQNASSTIGLFQGMFEGNILTFNPGWTAKAEVLDSFDDIRDIQARLEAAGIELTDRADEGSTDVASATLADPDGNIILLDQHVPRPGA